VFVGCCELVPLDTRRPQGIEGTAGVATLEADRSGRSHRGRHQERGVYLGGDPVELVGRSRCGVDIAGGEHDLHGAAEHLGAGDVVAMLFQDAADRRLGHVGPALHQTEIGQARLGLVAVAAGFPIGGLGVGEVPSEPVELTELIQRHPDGGLPGRVGQPIASPLGLGQRVKPRAMPLHDLGAMHQTLATERHHVGLAVAPVAQSSRPLVSPT
jgi:hypothetical protein